MDKIKLGISSCLLGESVRYDGANKLDHFLKSKFNKFVEWVGVCPEAECGLGIPREAMRLVGAQESPRIVTNITNIDHTERMLKWVKRRLGELKKEKISGFIFKSNSPSCGLYNTAHKKGAGIFTMEFIKYFRGLPVVDEEAIQEKSVRKKFIEDISAYRSSA